MDHYRRLISSNDSAGPRNRAAGLDELEKLAGLLPAERQLLRILFEKVWPADSPADFKPDSWLVGIPLFSTSPKVETLASLLGLKRTRTDNHVKSLMALGLIESTRNGGSSGGYAINWSRVFGCDETFQPSAQPSGNPPTIERRVSGGLDSQPSGGSEGYRRVDDEIGGLEAEGRRVETGGSEGWDSDDSEVLDPITHTIQQGCYYIANVMKVATKEAGEAQTSLILQKLDLILEALNRLQPSAQSSEGRTVEQPSNPPTTLQPSDPLKLNIEDSSSIKSIEIELKKENPPTHQPSAEKSEGRTVAAPVFDLGSVKYSGLGAADRWHPGRGVNREELANNAKLWQLWQHAVETFNWPNGLAGLRDFMAAVEFAMKLPGDPGGRLINQINARKFGPNRTMDGIANSRADKRLGEMFPTSRDSPLPAAARQIADARSLERDELFAMSIEQCRRLLTDLAKARFIEAEQAGKDPRADRQIMADLVRAFRSRQRQEAPT